MRFSGAGHEAQRQPATQGDMTHIDRPGTVRCRDPLRAAQTVPCESGLSAPRQSVGYRCALASG